MKANPSCWNGNDNIIYSLYLLVYYFYTHAYIYILYFIYLISATQQQSQFFKLEKDDANKQRRDEVKDQ